jgi:putative flippase GtrA
MAPAPRIRAASTERVLRQLVGFTFVGAARTALSYLAYLTLLLVFPYWLAFTFAYVATIAFSLFVNSNYVFAVDVTVGRAVRYALIYCLNYGLSLAVLTLAIGMLHLRPAVAPVAVIVVLFPINFLTERYALTV